ncbi:MAG: hypothetical protein RL748_1030 [Pseudomonadota bacterium]
MAGASIRLLLGKLTGMSDLKATQIEQIRHALASSSLDFILQKIGDHWTISIILQAFLGVQQFDLFHHNLGIPRQTLSVRLKQLLELGVLQREANRYRLSSMGRGLYPLVLMCHAWENRWGASGQMLPATIAHGQHNLQARLVCRHCRQPADVTTVLPQYVPGCTAPEWPGRRARRGIANGSDAQARVVMVGIVANRWSMLLMTAICLGCHRNHELAQVLGLGSKLLADRLKSLCELGLLQKRADLVDARRFVYTATPAGRDLFAFIVLISQWCEKWLLKGQGSIRLMHLPCGQMLTPEVICQQCQQTAVLAEGEMKF